MGHTRNLILVGRKGNGKSATGNSILGREEFKSMTTCVKEATVLNNDRTINVIDTPGLDDIFGDPYSIQKEISNCIERRKDNDVILLVLSLEKRSWRKEKDALTNLIKLFGDKIRDYMIVVFSGGDELEANDESIDTLLGRDCPKSLTDILEMCGRRYVVMDNSTTDKGKMNEQLQKLYGLVEMVQKNQGDDTRNLVLVGRTGNGKSATGNSILGAKKFKSKISAVGVTTTCAKETVKAGGQTINVIDTPGFYDFSGDPDRIQKEIIGCMKGLEKDDGIHAVLVVLSVKNRFTKEEMNAVSFLTTCFSDKISDYMIVVITGGDELEANDESITIEDLLGSDVLLKDILKMCRNRYVVMDNRTTDKDKMNEQLQKLYGLVEQVFENNGRKPYMKDFSETKQEESKLSNDMEKEPAQKAQVDMTNRQQNSIRVSKDEGS